MELSSLERVKSAFYAGNHREAIKIAAGFPHLGEQRDRIQTAWSALRNPDFYREIGVDVDAAVASAVSAIRERWSL